MRKNINTAARADHAEQLRECVKILKEDVYYATLDHGLPGAAEEIKEIVKSLEQIAAEGVKA